LQEEFGDEWLEKGVYRHLASEYFERTKAMLDAPMRVVDMGKTDDELFGVEHLGNVVKGNWRLFRDRLGSRERVDVYLGEIAEVRHNVAHRRKRHVLRRSEVSRLCQNCAILLRGVESDQADQFSRVVESLNAGATPWGSALGGYLPPQDEVVQEFVGRPEQLRELSVWLASDSPQLLLWGYGGAGKSALAYEWARDMREAAPMGINAVAWVSAKRLEFVAGVTRPRRADFVDRATLVASIFNSIYELDLAKDELSEEMLLDQLRELPVLLVVDDFDTVLEDEPLIEFLMHDVRVTGTRVLYTSRQRVPGVRSIEVLGFEGNELEEFVQLRAYEHELDPRPCCQRLSAIHSVTGGFPLFVDDLLRYARLDGIDAALEDWSHRKGDIAREYALRRQLENLGDISRDVLVALAVSDRPLTTLEMATVASLNDDDAEIAVQGLLRWRLVNRVASPDEGRPSFGMNLNTRRLALRTYGGDPRTDAYKARCRALGTSRQPAAKSKAAAQAIGVSVSLVTRGDYEGAITELKKRMSGELADSPDLHGALAWAYSRIPDDHFDDARAAFERAFELGNTKEDTYLHWAELEVERGHALLGRVPDDELRGYWRRGAEAAERGVRVCGVTRALSRIAAYARSREAKTLVRLNEFSQAEGAFSESVAHFRRALDAPASGARDVSRARLLEGLIVALEGLDDKEGVLSAQDELAKLGVATGMDRANVKGTGQ
jgi:hypothetical protein